MSDTFVPGAQFGTFKIEAEIGRGGMGLVYRAIETSLERPVALKVIAPDLAADPRFRERFTREARRAAAIDHAAIIPIYATGEIDGRPYLAMRYVDGPDLRTLIQRQGRLPAARALAIAHQIAGALDVAHAGGLVHRDVKPANILVESIAGGTERAYLTDFGLTRDQSDTRLTQTGRWMGTVDYMPPEQFRGGEVDGRADQYALACVLHELLTGNPPYSRDVDLAAMYAHLNEPPPRLTDSLRELPQAVDPVLARAMAKDATERYSSCAAFVDALEQAMSAGSGASATQTGPVAMPLPSGAAPTDTLVGYPNPAGAAETQPPAPTPTPTVTGSVPMPPRPPAPPRPSGDRNRAIAVAAGVVAVVVIAVVVVLIATSGSTHKPKVVAGGTGTTATTVSTHTATTPVVYPPATPAQWVDFALNTPSPSGSIAYDIADVGIIANLTLTFDAKQLRVHYSSGFPQVDEEWLMPASGGSVEWACTAGDPVKNTDWQCFEPSNISPSFRQLIRFRNQKWVLALTRAGIAANLGPLRSTTVASGTLLDTETLVGQPTACIDGTVNKIIRNACVSKTGYILYYTSGADAGHKVGLSITPASLKTTLPNNAFTPPAPLG